MRASDLAIGVAAVFFGFGAVVMAAADASPWASGTFVGLAALVLIAVALRVHVAPRVVVVGDRHEEMVRELRDELDRMEIVVGMCPGPSGREGGCPVDRGEACPLASHQQAAIVVRDSHDTSPVPPCERGLAVPMVLADEAVEPRALLRSLAVG